MEGRCLAPRYGRKAVIFVIWASGEEACVRRLFPGRIAVAKRQSAFWIQKRHGVNRPSVHVVPHSSAQTSLAVLAIGAREEKATATRLFAEQVVPLLASGAVRPVIDKVFSIEDVRQAHQRIESNESFGKVVLMM